MTLEQRRDQLVQEIDVLLEIVVSPDTFPLRNPDGSPHEGSLLAELERQLAEKTAELGAINARMTSPLYRFHADSYKIRWWIRLAAIMLVVTAFPFTAALGPDFRILYVVVAILSVVWAVWSSFPPKV